MDNDKVLALIPVMEVKSYLTGKRGVSLPFTDFCDPIIDDQISVGNFFTFAKDFGKDQGWRYLEVRGKGYQFEKFLASASFYRHILPLADGREALFHRFRKGTKSSIKKAEKDGVKVEMFTSIESLREFYKLNCITRKFHGLPPSRGASLSCSIDQSFQKGWGLSSWPITRDSVSREEFFLILAIRPSISMELRIEDIRASRQQP